MLDRSLIIGLATFVLTASVLAIPAIAQPHGGHGESMTRAQVEARVAERFAASDLDNDGAITREEAEARRDTRRSQRLDRRFARLDANGDGEVSMAERDAAREAHRERRAARRAQRPVRRGDMIAEESNMRERVTVEEMRAAAERQGLDAPNPEAWRERRAERAAQRAAAWDAADTDGNGALDRNEFAAMGETRRANMAERRASRFEQQDANGDGRLSLAEISSRAMERFDAADADDDGVVTLEERRTAHRNHRRAMYIENQQNRVY